MKSGKQVWLQSLENLIRIKYLQATEKDKAVIPILERTLEEKKKLKED